MKLKGKKKVNVTWTIASKIWWGFFWRFVLWGMPPGFFVAILVAGIGKVFGFNAGVIGLITWVIVWILVGIFVFKRILTKNYRDFQIFLIADDDEIPWGIEEDAGEEIEAGQKLKEDIMEGGEEKIEKDTEGDTEEGPEKEG